LGEMKFKVLQDNLRKILWEYIDAGELTGLRLAEQTGFKQAHISNFLNRKRGLSLEGMDRVLNVQHLSGLDLIDPAEVNKPASILLRGEELRGRRPQEWGTLCDYEGGRAGRSQHVPTHNARCHPIARPPLQFTESLPQR